MSAYRRQVRVYPSGSARGALLAEAKDGRCPICDKGKRLNSRIVCGRPACVRRWALLCYRDKRRGLRHRVVGLVGLSNIQAPEGGHATPTVHQG